MIERNKNPYGRISNMIFGLCTITDGLVRVCSLGFLHTRFTLEYTKYQAKRRYDQQSTAGQDDLAVPTLKKNIGKQQDKDGTGS